MNKYRKIGVTACILTVLTLAGCGQGKVPDVVSETSLAIGEDGKVTSYLVEDFDKEYYDISELASMAITEAAGYNTENQTGEAIPVTVDKVETLADGSGKVVVIHKYDNADVFEDYNGSKLFFGTVQAAVDAGYEPDGTLKSVKDDTPLSKEELMQNGEGLVIVTGERARIYCPKKVTYISEGAVMAEDGSVDTTQAEGMVVILMKK